jgi:DNA-binding response OmpR family regulator
MAKKILYIEDEPFLARIVKETLELKGYEVMHKTNGLKIEELVRSFNPDICILDVMLPSIDGFTLGETIRSHHDKLPIIFLTAKSQTEDVVRGFSTGGNDYLKKPFSMEELIVRIENQLRTVNKKEKEKSAGTDEVKLGKCIFYPNKFELHTASGINKLSHREAQILSIFSEHINDVIDRRMLLQTVWGDDTFFNSRNLDVYIRKIREYFERNTEIEIITLKGKGYHFLVNAH